MQAPLQLHDQSGGPPIGVTERRAVSWLTQAGILVRKDIAIEVRTGEVLVTSGFFAVLVVFPL